MPLATSQFSDAHGRTSVCLGGVKRIHEFDSWADTTYTAKWIPGSTISEVYVFMMSRHMALLFFIALLLGSLVLAAPGHGEDVQTAEERGKTALKQGKVYEALEIFSHLIAIAPKAHLYYHRGTAYASKNQHAAAIRDFNEAISLKPDDPSYHLQRGMSLLESQQPQKAVDDFTRVLELDPTNVYALANRARARFALNRTDMALDDVTEAIQHLQTNASLYKLRGDIFCSTGSYDRAIADYDRAIELNPNYAVAYNNRGTALANMGKNKEALQDLITAMEVAEASPSVSHLPGFAPNSW